MDLADLQRHWHAFGEQDPLWAILTDPTRKGGRWTPAEFFATGVAEITGFIDDAGAFGLPMARRRALDFGCGVGRLTQALAEHADRVIGLDVAPSMVAHAQRYNQHGDRVAYRVQAAPPLDGIDTRSIDLVYAGRVLQHIDPAYSRAYIAELARVVAPGGFLSFDVPGRWLDTPAMPGGALAPGAYRAGLDVTLRVDGDRLRVDVTVMNTSPVPWPAGAAINAGNRWLTRDGAVVIADDQRAPVRLPLGPGQLTRLTLEVPRPVAPNAEVLEIDLVHEGVTWFAWQGSAAVRVDPATGRAPDLAAQAASTAPAAAADFEPVMEMHAVPRTDVEAILQAAGVTLLRVRPEAHCGPNWEAWRYDVTAGAAR
jgi:SAM-dependent methyltransferase